jgi:hypothetical protein
MDIVHCPEFKVVIPTDQTEYTKTKLYGINKFGSYQNNIGFRDFSSRGYLNPQPEQPKLRPPKFSGSPYVSYGRFYFNPDLENPTIIDGNRSSYAQLNLQ